MKGLISPDLKARDNSAPRHGLQLLECSSNFPTAPSNIAAIPSLWKWGLVGWFLCNIIMARRVASRLSIFSASVTNSRLISRSVLTLSEVSMKDQAKEVYKPEKEVADLGWPRTDFTYTRNIYI